MIRSVGLEKTTFNELPYKFEAGTPAIAEAVGFGAAIDYITEIGLAAIERHEHALDDQSMGRLAELPWVRLFGPPPDRRAGIVSFEVEGIHPHDVAQILDWEGVAVRAGHHCTQPLMARLGVLGHHARKLLRVLHPRGGRPARRRSPQGEEGSRMSEFAAAGTARLSSTTTRRPRNHGLLDPSDAVAEGQNPLCGDEVSVSVRFGAGDVIEDVGFEGRGCAISQAATSMLTDIVKGRTVQEVAVMPKEELLEEIGIPLTPAASQVRSARPRRPQGGAAQGRREHRFPTSGARRTARSPSSSDGRGRGLPARGASARHGSDRRGGAAPLAIGVYNCDGELYALEDQLLTRRRAAV